MAKAKKPDRRWRNKNWYVADEAGITHSVVKQGVILAVLMDIRDETRKARGELRELNRLLHCPNFVQVPRKLDEIVEQLKRQGQGG